MPNCKMTGQKKDPRSAIPGFEIYARLKPIVPLWQWFIFPVVLGLVLILFSSPLWLGLPSDGLWPIPIFALFLTGFVLAVALILRGKTPAVGIKRVGSTVVMGGKTLSETLSPASKVELTSPSSIRLEKPGGQMQLRKMILQFSSSNDAEQVYGWLEHPSEATINFDVDTNKSDEVWALVSAGEGYIKRSRIQFERDICFVVDPGSHIFEVVPRKLTRRDEVTLVAATGFWNYGNVVMRFDSSSDSDKIERRLKQKMQSP